jgi:hypothetical protein
MGEPVKTFISLQHTIFNKTAFGKMKILGVYAYRFNIKAYNIGVEVYARRVLPSEKQTLSMTRRLPRKARVGKTSRKPFCKGLNRPQ